MRQCMYCDYPVVFNGGWTHQGGSPYMMECPQCGWHGWQPDYPNPLTIHTDVCPECGAVGQLRDDHVATPKAGGKNADNKNL